MNKAYLVYGTIYDYSKVEWVSCDKKVCIHCKKHNCDFYVIPRRFLAGSCCPLCTKEDYYELKRLNMEAAFFEKAKIVHGDKYDYSKVVYINNETKVCIICPEHGEFWQTPHDHLRDRGCPKCTDWKLESLVCNLLQDNNINSQAQKTFDWLKTEKANGRLRCDYYLPDYNLAIECQGRQHFKYAPYYHKNGESDFIEQQYRDDIKNKLCKEHGIEILYFALNRKYIKDYRYPVITDIDELLKEILKRGDRDGTVSK